MEILLIPLAFLIVFFIVICILSEGTEDERFYYLGKLHEKLGDEKFDELLDMQIRIKKNKE